MKLAQLPQLRNLMHQDPNVANELIRIAGIAKIIKANKATGTNFSPHFKFLWRMTSEFFFSYWFRANEKYSQSVEVYDHKASRTQFNVSNFKFMNWNVFASALFANTFRGFEVNRPLSERKRKKIWWKVMSAILMDSMTNRFFMIQILAEFVEMLKLWLVKCSENFFK